MKNIKKIIAIVIIFVVLIVVGTSGYMKILDVSFIDALYMTVITISTVGYGEVAEMNSAAKIFSMVIIVSGLSVVGYGVTSIVAFFFEGDLQKAWRKRRMEGKISDLKDHYIICGAGELGQIIIKSFTESKVDFVVIEMSEKTAEELLLENIMTVQGDATTETALIKAGIENAKGLVCVLSNDADNVFTVLTARQMNQDIYIVSESIDKNAHKKLLKAGANKTLSPSEIGGKRMAALMTRPSIISFLDVITRAGDVTLDLEEVSIIPGSHLIGKKLFEAKIPEKTGLIVMALTRKGETVPKFNPSSSETLNEEDIMIVLGTREQVDLLSKMVAK